MKWVFVSWTLLVALAVNGQTGTDSLLKELTDVLARSKDYDSAKQKTITQLHTRLNTSPANDFHTLFSLYRDLYNEYRIFHYDSAYRYAGKMQDLAYQSGDKQLITEARLNL